MKEKWLYEVTTLTVTVKKSYLVLAENEGDAEDFLEWPIDNPSILIGMNFLDPPEEMAYYNINAIENTEEVGLSDAIKEGWLKPEDYERMGVVICPDCKEPVMMGDIAEGSGVCLDCDFERGKQQRLV